MPITRMNMIYIVCVVFLLPSAALAATEVKPDLITTENNDYYGYMKEFTGFQCQATGTNLKYSWKHNDIIIDETYIIKFPKWNASTLQPLVNNIDSSYRGFYQCFVQNSIGTIFGRKANVEFTIIGDFLEGKDDPTRMVDVTVGRPFPLHCPDHATSQNVKYNWHYLEGDVRQTLPANENYFIARNGTLYFSVVRQEDVNFINKHDGILCEQLAEPEGAASQSKQSIRLKFNKVGAAVTPAKRKPEILTNIPSKAISYGSRQLVLKCGATGYPVPTLKWYRVESVSNAETEIVGEGDFVLSRFNQFLTIKNVAADKAGQYKCVANNSEGTVEKSGSVKVAEFPQWMANGEITDRSPPLGSRLEWPCGAFGGPTYNWFRNGVKIPERSPDGKVVIENKNSRSYLIIKNVTVEYNGMYQCTAGNELDIIYSTARLKIRESKPKFSEEMGPVTLIENRTGIIPCPIVASPVAVITWRKNGITIILKGKVIDKYKDEVKLAANGLDLEITKVKMEDVGTYLCQGENRNGVVYDDSEVSVGKDIHFTAAPVSNRNVTITLRFELQCEAEGDPSYEIGYRWLRNGLPLEYSARIHWVKEAHRLVILDAIVDDTGTYTCIASAETPQYIEKRKEVDIVVKAPADPPDIVWVIGSCWDAENEGADLAWKVGALNNEEVYEYWIDWATTYDPTNWTRLPKVLEEDPKPVKLDFSLLPPFSQISFRVTIFNRIGAGDPSAPTNPSDCITRPAAPRFSPVEIRGVPGGPNTLRLEWTPVPQTFWGAPGFNYTVQWRRRKTGVELKEGWPDFSLSQGIRIDDGNNNSVSVKNPGYFVEWQFRIRSNNYKGSAPEWTYGSSFSGQDAPTVKPEGLAPDRITARSADISWGRVAPPKNGSIFGYKIQYWHSGVGMEVIYDKNPVNFTIDLETIDELERSREERYRDSRSVEKRDVEARNRPRSLRKRDTRTRNMPLTKNERQASIVDRYLASKGISVTKRDTYSNNVPRIRTKREDEDENEEKEEPLDLCFNPDEPCYQDAAEKESQLEELTPFKTYHVRIAAYNSGGLGPWSDELIFNTAEAPPGPPYSVNTYAYDKYCKITWKEPRHMNGKIIGYEVYGFKIIRTTLPWWQRRHIIYDLSPNDIYEAKIRARTSSGWGIPVFRWFATHETSEAPAKPLPPEVVGYGEDGVNVTFQEPLPKTLRKFGGEMDEDPWELRPVGGYEMENEGVGGYPERFYVVYRRLNTKEEKETERKQMFGEQDQTWIVIENLEKDTVYEFATVPVNAKGPGPRSEWVRGLTGGIVPAIEKLHWYQRDWFIALIVLFFAAVLLLIIVVLTTAHIKGIYYEGAPRRRKDREREKIYEPEDVDGGFSEFTLKSARSSRSVVTSRSEPPPAYNSVLGSVSRHSGDFDDDEDVTDSDDEKHEVSTYYSDEKKIPLDDLDEDDEEDSQFATFV